MLAQLRTLAFRAANSASSMTRREERVGSESLRFGKRKKDAMTQDTTEPSTTKMSRHRGRATASITLIVVASLLLPLAGMTVWVRNLVLDPSRYVDTVAPLSKDPDVREAVATRVSTELVVALDVRKRAASALPKRAKFLAAPIAAGAQQLVHTSTLKILESDQFDKVWRFANQRAHDQIVNALTGRKGNAVTTSDGKVILNLGPLARAVAGRLGELGIEVPKNLDVSALDVKFVLIDSADLRSAQTYSRMLDQLAWVLPALTLVLFGLAVLIAPRRRNAVLRVGVGITIAMAVSVIAYGFARTTYLDNLPPTVQNHAAAAAIFDTVTRFVERGLRALLAIGLLVWLAAWLAGPSRPAEAVRRQWNRALGRAGSGLGSAAEIGPVNRWVAKNSTGLRIGLVAALLLLLLAWERPTGLVVVLFAVVGLVGVGVIQLLGAGGAEATDASASHA